MNALNEFYSKKLPPKKSSNSSILEEALSVTSGPRRRDYDRAEPNHERIARLFNAYIQCRKEPTAELSALDVAHLMVLLKLARAVFTPTRDSYVDIAGYARCAAEIAGFEEVK
jgi:hypothetical protein